MRKTKNFSYVSDKRTQIYLPGDLYKKAKIAADQQGISMAEVVRDALVSKLCEPSPEYKTGYNDLLEVVGIAKGGDNDVSQNMSKYIKEMYREKKTKRKKS